MESAFGKLVTVPGELYETGVFDLSRVSGSETKSLSVCLSVFTSVRLSVCPSVYATKTGLMRMRLLSYYENVPCPLSRNRHSVPLNQRYKQVTLSHFFF